jgi:hypothetical protein
MTFRGGALAALAVWAVACSRSPKKPPAAAASEVRILNFYATAPRLARGERELLCYGVENAKSVWMEPPRHELSAALSRCVEVEPKENTTYTLTAADAAGKQIAQSVTVTLGAAKAKILEVRVSSVEIAKGDPVSICWKTENAKVKVAPLLAPQPAMPNCVVDMPVRTTTYTVTATGTDGDEDREQVTVKVR